ncbi:hypothetical protein KTR66_09820 [Roseococcus sp. SDR]|uniref:hypothetical protein n=1 Tax=Roseococcus sp. SDR TaxID=2835532 RepID=UPI001BCAF3FF|nr:hypothetical protein [Roseococcus sp. SDR]MBS7790294.1 hypothetical protein [Roseococcus sp. SDR]MBV1845608.1 hypothetical protein [Roseococcus sp. SDR]
MTKATTASLLRSIESSTAAIREAAAAGNRDRVISLLYTTRDVINCLPAGKRTDAIAGLRGVMREIDVGRLCQDNTVALAMI